MDIQFLISFKIQTDMVDLFDIMMIKISIAGEKEHNLYHNGHGVNANVAYAFNGPTLHQMHFPFKATIQDYACFHFIESIQRASIKLTADHLPKIE
jgi:hypothetical protein